MEIKKLQLFRKSCSEFGLLDVRDRDVEISDGDLFNQDLIQGKTYMDPLCVISIAHILGTPFSGL